MKTLLWYSGGKDSLAVLLLNKDKWADPDFHVAWVDTGNQFPEVYAHMEKVKGLVRNFHTVRSDTVTWQFANGRPVDLVPTSFDKTGQYIYSTRPHYSPYVSRWECCKANMWTPMEHFMTLMRPKTVLRGDRGEERAEGAKEAEGIKVEFPIFDWTAEQVLAYIQKEGSELGLVQPRHFLHEGSSLDCMTCTAYHCEHKGRMEYLKQYHPGLYEANRVFFERYKEDIFHDLKEIL